MNRYSYQDLRKAAVAPGATQAEINALGAWMQEYGSAFWNGEIFDIGGGRLLRPVYSAIENENGGYDITGWEVF